jgi:hypothetical protein
MGDYHITSFDKERYNQLITYLNSVDENINKDPGALGPASDLKLDASLGTRLKPGSSTWDVAKNFAAQAGTFGNSAHTRYTDVEKEVRTFVSALKNAVDVFDETGDLANYDASKFRREYPDVGGGST